MKKWLIISGSTIVLICGLLSILMALRRPWIKPVPGVRLEPARPILLEKDVKPDSAYDLLLQACAAHTVNGDREYKALEEELHTLPWSLDGTTNVLPVLEDVETCLALARRAAQAPNPQVPTMPTYEPHLPSIVGLLGINWSFNISAKVKTARGDYSGAFAELRSAVGFSSILTRGGLPFGHAVNSAYCNVSCKTMREIALNYIVMEDVLRDTMRFLKDTENGLEPWAECIRHECVLWHSCVDQFFRDPSPLRLTGYLGSGYFSESYYQALQLVAPLLGSTSGIMKKDMDAVCTHLVSMGEKPYDEVDYARFGKSLSLSGSSHEMVLSVLTSRGILSDES